MKKIYPEDKYTINKEFDAGRMLIYTKTPGNIKASFDNMFNSISID